MEHFYQFFFHLYVLTCHQHVHYFRWLLPRPYMSYMCTTSLQLNRNCLWFLPVQCNYLIRQLLSIFLYKTYTYYSTNPYQPEHKLIPQLQIWVALPANIYLPMAQGLRSRGLGLGFSVFNETLCAQIVRNNFAILICKEKCSGHCITLTGTVQNCDAKNPLSESLSYTGFLEKKLCFDAPNGGSLLFSQRFNLI